MSIGAIDPAFVLDLFKGPLRGQKKGFNYYAWYFIIIIFSYDYNLKTVGFRHIPHLEMITRQ